VIDVLLAAALPIAGVPPVVHASYAMYALTILLLLPVLLFILLAKRGKELYIRRIPGIDAIEEAIGRATELGRPMMFSTGLTGLNALLYALLGILRYVAGKSAAYGCRLIIPQCDYEVMPIVEETAREAYRAAGRLDQFNPQDVRFLSTSQFAFASGYMGIAHREKAASCFLFGHFAAESLILAEAGQQIGAMQVAGTPTYTQVPFFLTSCDYTIIGEEVYAAGAYLSREPSQLGSVRGLDVAKLVVLTMILLGLTASTFMSVKNHDTLEGKEFNSPFAQALFVQPEQKQLLARATGKDSYRPPAAPQHSDLEEDLASARGHLGYYARLARGQMHAIARNLRREAEALSGAVNAFPEGPGRDDARAVADRMLKIAGSAEDHVKDLKKVYAEEVPAMSKAHADDSRGRAAELFKPELDRLAYWVSKQPAKTPGLQRCRERLVAAEKALASPTSGARAILRAAEAARQACYDAHFAGVKKTFHGAELAAEDSTPRFMLKTAASLSAKKVDALNKAIDNRVKDENDKRAKRGLPALNKDEEAVLRRNTWQALFGRLLTGLLLSGRDSVSARGRPLPFSYEWKVTDPKAEKTVFATRGGRPVVPVVFPAPGKYDVKLELSEDRAVQRVILGVDGTKPTEVEYKQLPVGCKLVLSWRMAKDALPKKEWKVVYDFGDGSRPVTLTNETKNTRVEHVYEEPGRYPLTVLATYKRRPARDLAAEKARAEASAARGAAPEVLATRDRLASRLSPVVEEFNLINKRLGAMEHYAAQYSDALAGRKTELSNARWPDRKLSAELLKRIRAQRKWVTDSTKFLARTRARAGVLGAAVAANKPEPAAGKAPAKAGGEQKGEAEVEGIDTWKRYRVYWTVFEPLRSSTSMTVVVEEAPERPRPPWMPVPAGEKKKAITEPMVAPKAAPAGDKKAGDN